MKKNTIAIGILIIVVAGGLIGWSKMLQNKQATTASTDPTIAAVNGLHWHPQLEIYVKGEKQNIPDNIGLVGGHKPIHTHDDVPIVHMEFQGKVTKDDTKLGEFFAVWGKKSEDFGQTVTMTVNGKPNTELMDYQMKDGDKIELRYE